MVKVCCSSTWKSKRAWSDGEDCLTFYLGRRGRSGGRG
jgi:hypothetical protein